MHISKKYTWTRYTVKPVIYAWIQVECYLYMILVHKFFYFLNPAINAAYINTLQMDPIDSVFVNRQK